MKNLRAYFSLGRTPDARLDLSVAIGSTVVRQIISGTLYLLAMWITTRRLGPHQNGILATVLLLPQTLFAFLNLGLGASHIYHLSSGTGNHRTMRQANWFLAAVLWLAVIGALILCTEDSIARYLPGIGKNLALFASLLLPMMLLAAWSSSLIQGNRNYQLYNRIMLVQPAVFCVAVVVLYAANSVNEFSILCCYLLSQLSLWLLSESKINDFSPPAASATRGLLDSIKYGLKAHLSNIITFLNYRLALYLVSYMLGTEATGQYVLSIQLAEVLWLISSAASMVVFPESAAHSKSPAELRKMITRIAGSVFQITFAGAVIAAAAAPFAIPWIFGKAYEGAVLPFIILLPGIVMWSYMSVISNSLAGMGHQKINILSALLCLSISIAGSFLAIPKFGVHGAALASTIAFSITTVFTIVMYMRIVVERPASSRRNDGMKTKKLIIVTSAYPYGRGEAFLEAELAHIAKYFDGVELVPCFYDGATPPRSAAHDVNLGYAQKRWGASRKFLILRSFVTALWQYQWLDDLLHILWRQHKFENLKELARALYRAKFFESFLAGRFAENKTEPGLIYFYWMTPEIMGAVAFRRRFAPALKIVSRAHGGDLYTEARIGNYSGLRDSILRSVDQVYCISDYGRTYLERKYAFATLKPRLARLGVNDPGYLNAQPSEPGLSIVSCAFVVPEKRLHLIVDAVRYLIDRNPSFEIKWTHIGDGGVLYQQLRAYVADKLGTRADVVFKGYLTQAQVMHLYRDENFDVFVNVSDSEGIPVSLMEASAVGIPMVATDVGGNSEIVNTANGILLPANPDIETIASAFLRFKDRPAALPYRRNARAQWEQKYNAAINHDSFGRQLINMLEHPAGTASPGLA